MVVVAWVSGFSEGGGEEGEEKKGKREENQEKTKTSEDVRRDGNDGVEASRPVMLPLLK